MKKIYYIFSLIDGLTATKPHSLATENFSVASDYSGLLQFHHQNEDEVKYDHIIFQLIVTSNTM